MNPPLSRLVNDGPETLTICGLDVNQTSTGYYYFLSTVYPLFELIIIFCLPLLINIICTIIIVRSLRIRMRTAKRFGALSETNSDSKKEPILSRMKSLLNSMLSCFIPRQTSKSNIYSCFCFQIQCRRHPQMRLHFGRHHDSLIKYQAEQDSNDRQPSSNLSNGLPPETPQITAIAATILNKKQQNRRTRDKHLSAMLIVLNILYFLLNLPFNFHQTFGRTLYKNTSDDCIMKFTHVLLDLLQQTYFSTNFFLYVLTNRRFREEFYNTIRRLVSRTDRTPSGARDRHRNQVGKRKGSYNPSAVMITQCHGDYQTIPIPLNQQRDSFVSEMELTEVPTFHSSTLAPPTPQHQLVMSDDKNRLISKLILYKELSSGQC